MGKLEDIIDLAQTTTDLQRRKKQSEKFSVYLDDFVGLVDQKIREQFHEDNYERLYKMIATYYNLLKKVVNSKSMLYKKAASRIWHKKGTEEIEGEQVPIEDEKYAEFIADTNINTASQTINKYANTNNISFMRLKINDIKKTIDYEAIPTENMVVLQDPNDPFIVIAVMHEIVTNNEIYWIYSDNEKTVKLSKDFSKQWDEQPALYLDPNTGTGIIPYVPVWATLPMANDFWAYTVNDDLYYATIQLNVHLTHFNNVMKTGCYKQITFTGVTTEDVKRLYDHVTDGLSPIALTGEGAKIDALLMAEKFSEFMDAIDLIASRVLDQHGFDLESQSKSASKSSGISIKLRQDQLNDIKEEQQPLFRDYESKLAYYTAVIANQVFGTGIDINGKLNINFFEENPGLLLEDTAVLDWQMGKGFKSVTEVFKKFNPDIPNAKIEQTIIDNIAEYKKLTGFGSETDNELDQAFEEEQTNTEV